MPDPTAWACASTQKSGNMIEVRPVTTKQEQKQFLDFPLDLYAGNPNFIPPLYPDEKKIFRKNYVYNSSCDSACFIAFKDGIIAGRIQAIIQKDANAKNNERRCRFTRYDVINDLEVSRALFETAENWARERGMDTIHGPLGYSDLEKEGMLVGGFKYPGTFLTPYNHPYYPEHVEALGYRKEVDYNGSYLYGAESNETFEEMEELVAFIFKRYKLHFGQARNGREFMKKYADGIFDLLDKSYEGLYGTVPFTPGMRKLMMENFGLVISPKYAAIILDENEKPVCFGLAIPSLAPAFTLTRGHITPGLILRFISCRYWPKTIDMCLIGADPEYLNRGISAALSVAIMRMFKDHPEIQYADTLLNLEENWAIQNQWKRFKRDIVKQYRCYVKSL